MIRTQPRSISPVKQHPRKVAAYSPSVASSGSLEFEFNAEKNKIIASHPHRSNANLTEAD